ncbi:MAG: 23S rRNA (adenine(2503)-C(2))-methyltransferase RlmN [Patescibacteria group bacterium]
MNIEKLFTILKEQPVYRVKQVKTAIFKNLIDDWAGALNLPLTLREELNKDCPLQIDGQVFQSTDKSFKSLITLADGLKIESVLLGHKDGHHTICVSSQIGCPLKCGFCATGQMGFKRNLTVWEIVMQVLFFLRYLKAKKIDLEKSINVVFMGMGEPFLNYDNVMAAIKILNDKDGLNIGARHISISTVGIIEGINKLAKENLQVNLAISLHAPEDSLRSKLVPVNEKYSIGKILSAVDSYIEKTSRRVMFEYILVDGVNDREKDAEQLAALMDRPLYFVNLISYNPTGKFKPSSAENINRFRQTLQRSGIFVTQRYHFGGKIKAACGQLAGD